ncbi:MAG: hypothetical protein AAGU74_11990 [Bacillota bacterium]
MNRMILTLRASVQNTVDDWLHIDALGDDIAIESAGFTHAPFTLTRPIRIACNGNTIARNILDFRKPCCVWPLDFVAT